MAYIWQLALKSWLSTAVMAGLLFLTACGGSDPTAEPDWAGNAARAGVSALTAPSDSENGQYSLTLAWTDTLDGELGWRVETPSGSTWQTLASVAAAPGVGQTLSVRREIAADTALRVLAVLPDGQTVVLGTAAQGTQLTARTRLPGVAIALAGTDQPLSGDTTLSLTGATGLLSALYSARAIGQGAVGDGLLGTPLSRTGPSFAVPWRSGLLADGTHRIEAKLEVETGNFIVLRRSVEVHNSGLRVGVAAELSGREVTLRLQLQSNVARPSFTVQVNGQQVAAQTLESGWQVQGLALPLGQLPPGEYEIVVRASDSSGASAQAQTRVRIAGELQARLDVADGAVAFDTLAISGEAGAPGNNSGTTVRLTLDQDLIFSSAGGSFSFTLDLARIPAGLRTLTLEVQEAGGRRATVTRTIDVRGLSPRFQRIKAIERGQTPSRLTGAASNGRIAVTNERCVGGGRYCVDVTTVDPNTPQTQLAYARFIEVEMNPDWTWFSASDGFGRNYGLLPAPGNPVVPSFGSCRTPGASTVCSRQATGLPVKEWAVVADAEPLSSATQNPVLRNMLTGVERPVPGNVVESIPVVPVAGGGWQWTVNTGSQYAVYDSTSGTSTPLGLAFNVLGLASDGTRLVWLAPLDSSAPRRRQLFTALPGATQNPQRLADYTITDSAASAGETTRAGGDWVVWAERDSATGLELLKANDGSQTREIARAFTIEILNFDADTGAVLWWDGWRSQLWAPGTGQQTVVVGARVSGVMTRRGLYLLLEDSALYGLSY